MSHNAPMTAGALRVGEPDVAGPLAVFPVFAPEPAVQFLSFAEAAAMGASVRELPGGASVNDVIAHNPLDVAVLLYDGEELRGAQQDRTLDRSVLLAPRSQTEIPVSCVEAGRWDGARADEPFTPSEQAAFPELRRAKSRAARHSAAGRAEQSEVWALVGRRAERHDARSDTGAMRDVFAARRSTVEALRAGIRRRHGQVGAVAAIAGRVCVADVVGRSDAFAALHAPLVAGYALDAADGDATGAPPTIAGVERFLAVAAEAPAAVAAREAAVGLGEHQRFATTRVEGARLTLGGELVTLTAFARERPTARVGRPSRRR